MLQCLSLVLKFHPSSSFSAPTSNQANHPWQSQSAIFCFISLFIFLLSEIFILLFRPALTILSLFHPCLNANFLKMPYHFLP